MMLDEQHSEELRALRNLERTVRAYSLTAHMIPAYRRQEMLAAAKPLETDPAWMASDEAKGFMRASAAAWSAAHIASGEDAETARRMAQNTAAFYTGG